MSAKLKVEELRVQLSLRGLDTAGTKPALVRRLESALRKEEESIGSVGDAIAPSGSGITKKRSREDAIPVDRLSKMPLRELRELAALRSVPANGSKKELVERLSADAEKDAEGTVEECDSIVPSNDSVTHKRSREATKDGVSIDSLPKMSVRELRELAALRGVPANGSKKELVERLSAHEEKDAKETVEGKEIEVEGVQEKLVKATKKGRAVLDQWLPDHVKSSYHVLKVGDEIYDAMLNQTNVGENNNKFYVIQALESDDGRMYMVYNRWGRVGVRGQDKLHGPYTSRERAINEFQMKFFDKTKNQWSHRKEFTCYPRCYTLLEMDYAESRETSVMNTAESIGAQLRETKLEPRIAKFISLICNISMMKQQMLEIGYNAEKLPLGKLSKSTILKGYDVLRRISDIIVQSDRKKLEQLSGEFYTVIPHDFGFKKMRDFVIDTPSKLKCKLEMVAALDEIEIATKLLTEDGTEDDPLYARYHSLHCELTPVEAGSEEFSMIKKYMQNTHAKTHSNYIVNIEQILKVFRQGESECFSKFADMKNRMLLWHGSRLSNWTGILSQGLRIAPPEAPVTGYMFGKGVYFADMFSKSANYCFASHESRDGVLLLCEVALGDMADLLAADYNADQLPKGKQSTKGVGATAPDMSESQTIENGVLVPLGKPKNQAGSKGSLMYNEYIVYNVEQIRMRYVVQVNFTFKQ